MSKALIVVIGSLLSLQVAAQHTNAQHHHLSSQQHSPYTTFKNREIKALSQQQIDDLKAGKGMSLALPAELNGYPGPSHTLELAEQLKLTETQRKQIQDLYAAMAAEAKKIGMDVIEAERQLDNLFKNKSVNTDNLKQAALNAGVANANLRESHLRYHLATIKILTNEQIEGYNKLRGY